MQKHYPTYGQAIGLLLLIIPIMLVGVLILIPIDLTTNVIATTLVGSISTAAVVFFGLRFRKNFNFSWGLFPASMILAAFVLIMCLSVVLDPLVNLLPSPDFLNEIFMEMAKYQLLMLFSVVLSAPFFEELCSGESF